MPSTLRAIFLLALQLLKAEGFLFPGSGCGNSCACPQPQCPPVQQCPSYPPCATPAPFALPPPPPAPLLPPPPSVPCPSACPPPILPFLPPPPCNPAPSSCGGLPPSPQPPAPIPPISSTNYGGPFAYPASIPSLPSIQPTNAPYGPSTLLPETTLSTLPPLVPLPTQGTGQTIPAALPPPPSLVPLNYQTSSQTGLPSSFTETEQPRPASPFQSAYVEELAPTLLPPQAQEYKTKFSKERMYYEGESTSKESQSGLADYEEAPGPVAPPAPSVAPQAVPYQLPGYIPAQGLVQTLPQALQQELPEGSSPAYPPDEEDDRIYAKDGEVKFVYFRHSAGGLTSGSAEYNPYFDGAHSSSNQQQSFETFDKRNALLKRYKSAKQLSSNTVQKTTTTCNSEKLARVMAKAISGDVSVAKKLVQKATELAFDGSKFDVFCANGEFSYSIHSRKYCEVTKEEITCFAFR